MKSRFRVLLLLVTVACGFCVTVCYAGAQDAPCSNPAGASIHCPSGPTFAAERSILRSGARPACRSGGPSNALHARNAGHSCCSGEPCGARLARLGSSSLGEHIRRTSSARNGLLRLADSLR